jgi:hypothetical protein
LTNNYISEKTSGDNEPWKRPGWRDYDQNNSGQRVDEDGRQIKSTIWVNKKTPQNRERRQINQERKGPVQKKIKERKKKKKADATEPHVCPFNLGK